MKTADRHATHGFLPALAVMLLSGLAACASREPPTVLLALPPLAAPLAAAPASASTAKRPVLVVRRLALPEYLLSRRVRYRTDASTLAEWPHTFWAERIEIGMTREFTAALRSELPDWAVCETGCPDVAPDFSLRLELAPLDYLRASQRMRAVAHFTLLAQGGGAPALNSAQQTFDLPVSADNPQGQAQALSELLRAAARAAAPMLNGAPAAPPGPREPVARR